VDAGQRQTNYSVSLVNGTLTVTQSGAVVTWTNPAPAIYGAALSVSQLNAAASVPGSFAYSPLAGTVLNAGTNLLSVIFTPTDTVDYSSVTDTVSWVVGRAPLSATANNAVRAYGAGNPVFTGTVLGLVNGDNITGAYSCSAGAGSPVGTYAIKVEAAGFKTENRRGVVLNVNDDLKINLPLEVGSLTESVEVKADRHARRDLRAQLRGGHGMVQARKAQRGPGWAGRGSSALRLRLADGAIRRITAGDVFFEGT